MTQDSPHLILFDCDGTLVDSHAAIIHAMQQAFADQGLERPAASAVSDIIGLSLAEAVAALTDDAGVHAAVVRSFRQHYVAGEKQLQLYPGVRETLQELQGRGYWLGIVTGKSKSGLLRVLDHFDLGGLFYVLRTADCCPSKPHPAMVLESMREMGVSPAQTCVVGDALLDIRMAGEAGVASFGVSFGMPMHEPLLQAGARAVVDEFAELLAHFPPLPDAVAAITIAKATA